MSRWTVRPAKPEDRDPALALLTRAFGGAADRPLQWARWDWLFLRNPCDRRLWYFVAEADSRLAGQYALLPVRLQHAGTEIRGLLSLDTATDPDFERQGIFTTLAEQLYAVTAGDFPLVFGFPNPSSSPVFFRKLGWQRLEPFPMLIRPITGLAPLIRQRWPVVSMALGVIDLAVGPLLRIHVRVLSLLGHNQASIEPLKEFGAWADGLWAANAPRLGTCVIRDRQFLNWRYFDSPFEYERFALMDRGEVRGFCVLAFDGAGQTVNAHVMELMTADPDDRVSVYGLLAHALRRASAKRAFTMSMIATTRHPHYRRLVRSGFLRAPARAWAFGFRANSPAAAPTECACIDDWYLSGSDLDFL